MKKRAYYRGPVDLFFLIAHCRCNPLASSASKVSNVWAEFIENYGQPGRVPFAHFTLRQVGCFVYPFLAPFYNFRVFPIDSINMSASEDLDIMASNTAGYIPAEKKPMDELLEMDVGNASLKKWKESLELTKDKGRQ